MNEIDKIKAKFVVGLSFICSYIGVVAIPWIALLILNLIDYGTGIAAAPYRSPGDEKPVKSYKSIHGIQKKVCMHLLIVIGWIIDIIISTSISWAGWQFSYPPVFSIVIALWLVFNEIISIIENMEDMGVPIPPFLLPIMKAMRKQVENKARNMESKEEIK